jgi:hypothetical protein
MREGVLVSEALTSVSQTVAARLQAPKGTGSPTTPLRVDDCAWSILAFWQHPDVQPLLDPLSDQLEKAQLPDGRVPINPRFPDAAWPTPLAALAWTRQTGRQSRIDSAVRFLLGWQGQHFSNPDRSVMGHDMSLHGWPWITGTHSWIEPTVMTLLALRANGRQNEPRCEEAHKMILDRQLSHGGWNFGNTTVFGQELRPMVHSTGMALTALANTTSREQVEASLRYLEKALPAIRAPLSLGWGLVGLTAWGLRPAPLETWVMESLALEKTTMEYSVALLGLLYCALLSPDQNPLLSIKATRIS